MGEAREPPLATILERMSAVLDATQRKANGKCDDDGEKGVQAYPASGVGPNA